MAETSEAPTTDHDPRFTMGLVLDIAEVLEDHGYPKPSGRGYVDLQQHLFQVLYGDGELKGLVEIIEQPEVSR